MEIIKPKDKKHLRELYFNPSLALGFVVLFLLNIFDLMVLTTNKNINFFYELLLIVLIVVFLAKSVLNLFYKIKVSEDIITFTTPFNLYNKRVAFKVIDDFRFTTKKVSDDILVFFLNTGEVISVGVKRYSKEQKRHLSNLIEKYAKL